MELVLTRTYHSNGTNGLLHLNGKPVCFTIELPWRNNKPCVSCIREGRYKLEKRYSDKFKFHLLVTGVADRSLILIHPANNAIKELQGCIAPVSTLTAPGCGNNSRGVFTPLLKLVYGAMAMEEEVWLTIIKDKTKNHDESVVGCVQ